MSFQGLGNAKKADLSTGNRLSGSVGKRDENRIAALRDGDTAIVNHGWLRCPLGRRMWPYLPHAVSNQGQKAHTEDIGSRDGRSRRGDDWLLLRCPYFRFDITHAVFSIFQGDPVATCTRRIPLQSNVKTRTSHRGYCSNSYWRDKSRDGRVSRCYRCW